VLFRAKRRTVVTTTAVAALLLAAALTVTLLTSGNGSASGGPIVYQAGHRPLVPEFTGTSLTGTKIQLSNYRGKTLVLNFWGSWCAPCRAEAPTLAVVAQQYRSRGVAFLGDNLEDTPVNALGFDRSYGITYPSVNDAGDSVVQAVSQAAPVSDTPTTVVIDKTGHLAGMILGMASYADLTRLLRDAEVTR
jgi:thiol-disulfide isomerase/thioredoxin